jgi:hypothetical protein
MLSSTAMIDKIGAGGFESGSAPTDSGSGSAECIGLVETALAGSGGGGASMSSIEPFIKCTKL